MSESAPRKLPKWPFLFSDLLLVGLGVFILGGAKGPLGPWELGLAVAAVAAGAIFCALPFLKEYQAATRLAETNVLAASLEHLRNIESVKTQIANATSQWDIAHDRAAKIVVSAGELTDRMSAETREFRAFLEKANEGEKSYLRLEVDKMRRAETEWLQVAVRILDHVYALHRAAARSGQTGLISEIGQFQHACRDAARRMGLVAVAPDRGASYEESAHHLSDGHHGIPAGARVTEVLATGYTFRGQPLRKPMVSIHLEPQGELPFGAAHNGDGATANGKGASHNEESPPERSVTV